MSGTQPNAQPVAAWSDGRTRHLVRQFVPHNGQGVSDPIPYVEGGYILQAEWVQFGIRVTWIVAEEGE